MPEVYTQKNRELAVTTPLGEDFLLLEKFAGRETISSDFEFDLNLLAQPKKSVDFDKLLGQSITVRLGPKNESPRYFNGIAVQVSEGTEVPASNNSDVFVRYWMKLVPSFHMLQNTVRSRIFQHKSVKDILTEVLTGLTTSFKLEGTYEPRNICCQYRESDYDFACRLMEEEGIYYFFQHADGSHTMVLGDTTNAHSDVPDTDKVAFRKFQGMRDREHDEPRIFIWHKTQVVGSGKFTVWDHCFEMPQKNLEANTEILATAAAGTVNHKLKVAGNEKYEVYEYPGFYAKRFDGISKGGGEQASELGKIETDNQRTSDIRMKQLTADDLVIAGAGNVPKFTAGSKFQLDNHFSANGKYVLTEIMHSADLIGTYTTDESTTLKYKNSFHCVPIAVPYLPQRVIARPIVHGTQTAVVVGTAGKEIDPDKYGRVKVQFRWDREGKKDLDSSCWVRVAQAWAGKQWGFLFLPRIGDEVIVAFLEGDPDRPIIVGSVYNYDQMPPYPLPEHATRSVIKTRSSQKGTTENFNELYFEDKKGSEEIYLHAEKDFNRVVENNDTLKVGFDKKDPGDQTIEIYNNRTETVEIGNETVTIKTGNRTVNIDTGNETLNIKKGNREDTLDTGNDTLVIKQGNHTITISAGKSTIEAAQSIELKVGGSTLKITPGDITLTSTMIKLDASGQAEVNGGTVKVAGDISTDVTGGTVSIN